MKRTARAHVDFQALRHNYEVAKKAAPQTRVMAVIKADAYGHGLRRVGQALSQADAFAVATLGEALVLRDAGVCQPVVVLLGMQDAAELPQFFQHDLQLVIHQKWHLDAIDQYSGSGKLFVWIETDTGMGRLGFPPASVQDVYGRLAAQPWVTKPLGLMTHMACADDPNNDFTRRQFETFYAISADLKAICSLANSGALLGWKETHADWARPGIMLYGVSPFMNQIGSELGLRPAMTLKTRLIAVNRRRKHSTLGYGRSWECPEDMPTGVAAIGYGDGYPRHAASGTPILVQGQRSQLLGRVSMDSLTLDLRGAEDVQPGAEVTLWGAGLPVEEVAATAGTIPYELLTSVGGKA